MENHGTTIEKHWKTIGNHRKTMKNTFEKQTIEKPLKTIENL